VRVVNAETAPGWRLPDTVYDTRAPDRSARLALRPPAPGGTHFAEIFSMRARVHRLVLGLALTSLTSLACGNTKNANRDGASGDGAACPSEPPFCAQGGPSGTGVSCGGLGTPGACVGGVWTCPKGMVDMRECTCGEPGLSCANQVCTTNGPVCLDAGVDATARQDAPVDGQVCGGEPLTYCWQIIQSSDVVICGDYGKPASCVDGQWKCLAGEIDGRMCTCTEFHPPGCAMCTAHGWACSDAGVDGDAASDSVAADGG
jgi:hypothetical protein